MQDMAVEKIKKGDVDVYQVIKRLCKNIKEWFYIVEESESKDKIYIVFRGNIAIKNFRTRREMLRYLQDMADATNSKDFYGIEKSFEKYKNEALQEQGREGQI